MTVFRKYPAIADHSFYRLLPISGLPLALDICFYIGYAFWLICILGWAGYKLNIVNIPFLPAPNGPTQLAAPEDGMVLERIFTPTTFTVTEPGLCLNQ